ncbi:hypothetical protein PBY51_003525 [Eleginops maclovinus]|nr:hypothetical protein PBY51_003525 [Eleginops maclovinus]
MDNSQHNGKVEEISKKLQTSLSMDTEDKMETYQRFIQEGKDVARQGDMDQALKFFKLAYKIHQSNKLEGRIQKIEELLAQDDSEEEDEEFVNVNGSGLMLFKELYDKLYDYQRNGVAFLYSLYRDGRKGGILADDMGLGKTIQVISFLSGMYDSELARFTLLVMPTSLIRNWTKEFAKWTPGMRVKEFHGATKERTRNLEKIQRRSGVIITTYTMLMNNWQQLASYNGKEFTWDYMILDEAHKVKSSTTKTAKSASTIPSKNRVLLTGTPVQNNLKELWALFDFACQGTLLGTAKTFKTEYENPITRAREKDTTPGEKALGSRMSENLMAIIKPYFLRRTKAEVQKNKGTILCKTEYSENKDSIVQNTPNGCGAEMPTLTRKNDLIVWTYLSPVQEDIYRQFISLDHIKELLMTTRSPLAELNIMKKLCDHPRLLSAAAIAKLGLEESTAAAQQNKDTGLCTIANIPDDTLIAESGKLVFLFALLERLREDGHRTLVFAHYRKVLDIIERILGNRGYKVLRLDGTIIQLAEREKLITKFQTDKSYSVFLLTTQVGGVGITLTAANRVVIYDPSWNPATDAQAVDRAYRIGQSENVVIYRLITCGTVEEKIYRRQVFKDSLIRQNTGDKKNPFRYFSKQELKELFLLEDTRSSSTQLQLQALHSRHRRTDAELDEHIAHLHTMEMFGISDHDLMFSLDVNHDDDPEDQEAHHYIEGRVQKAQELMKAESDLQMQMTESMASNTEPAWLRQPSDNHIREQSEKKPRNPKPSPSYPQYDSNSNGSPAVIDLDLTGSDEDDGQHYLTGNVIDLTADEGMSEEHPIIEVNQGELAELNLYSPKHVSVNQERSYLVVEESSPPEVIEESLVVSDTSDAELGDMADASNPKLKDLVSLCEAAIDSAGDGSMLYVTADNEDEKLPNGTSQSRNNSKIDLDLSHSTALQNKSLSVLQASTSSFKADKSSNQDGTGLESFGGNFNLQLEDSDTPSDPGDLDNQDTEEQERELLSQLQMEGSFNINKSLCEKQHKEAVSPSLTRNNSETDSSMDHSIVINRRKRAAVIRDSDEDDEDDVDDGSHLENSFQVLGASTPKLVSSVRTPLRSRKSVGGNTSVASRKSFILSIMEDMENNKDGSTDNQEMNSEDEEDDVSERHSDEAEEDFIGSTHDEIQLEETLDIEGEEDVEEEEAEVKGENEYDEDDDAESVEDIEESEQEMSSNMEESTSELELASDERMDQCTADGVKLSRNSVLSEDESFDALVRKGKEYQSKGKPDEALSCFLRAIDIKPGDPVVQLMTIQLYRQLSQKS